MNDGTKGKGDLNCDRKLVLRENCGMPAKQFDCQSSKIKANDLINMPGKRVSAMR